MDGVTSGWVRGFDAASVKERWVRNNPAMVSSGITATGGDLMLAGDQDGWLLALDAASGKLLNSGFLRHA